MKRKVIFAGLLVLILAVTMQVFAADVDSILLDRETGQVTVTISCPGVEENTDVLMVMLRPGAKAEQIESSVGSEGISTVMTARVQEGKAVLKHCLNMEPGAETYDPSGIYTVLFSVDGEMGKTETFSFFTASETEAALDVVAVPGGDLEAAYRQVKDVLGLDDSFFGTLTGTKSTALKNFFGKKYDNEEAAAQAFKCAVAVQAVNEAAAYEDMQRIIERAGEVLQLKIGTKDPYQTELSAAGRQAVLEEVAAKNSYQQAEEVREQFDRAVLFKQIIYAKSYGVLEQLLMDNRTLLGLDLGTYNRVQKKGEVAIAFLRDKASGLKSLDDVKPAFEACAQSQYNKENTVSSSPGGGGSGGGGSRGGGSISVPSSEQSKELIPLGEKLPRQKREVAFYDLTDVPWAEESVLELASYGIINGKAEGIFAPDDFVTREEFVKILIGAMDVTDDAASCVFEDVKETDYFYKSLATAVDAGIIQGTGNGKFGTGESITREDIAVICVRAAEFLGLSLPKNVGEAEFTDRAEISGYALQSVKTMQQAGILNGRESGSFAPRQSATRAEAAKIIYGFCVALALL